MVELVTLGVPIKETYEGEPNTNAFTDAEKAKLAALTQGLESVQAGTNITIDDTDPLNPIISASGGGSLSYDSAVADVNILAGQATYLKLNGHIELAQADSVSTSNFFGLANANANSGFQCAVSNNSTLTLTDWTAATGSASLTVGRKYYLDKDNAGMITLTPPTGTGVSIYAGLAVKSDSLKVDFTNRVKL